MKTIILSFLFIAIGSLSSFGQRQDGFPGLTGNNMVQFVADPADKFATENTVVTLPLGKVTEPKTSAAILGPLLVNTTVAVITWPGVPATGTAIVTLTSTIAVTVTVTVFLSFTGLVSVVPTGTLTVATLTIEPVALPATLTWKVTLALAPLASVLVPLMVLPATLPLIVPLVATPVMVPKLPGKVSDQLAATTALGPLLVITMV